MPETINDIIQKHMNDRACTHTEHEMIYQIKGGSNNMYHCKFVGDCVYKKNIGIIINCNYFEKLSEKIKTFQHHT